MPIDYSKYPLNWKTEIVPRILKRAADHCEFCGLHKYQVVGSLRLWIRSNNTGRYGYRSIWFNDMAEAVRYKHLGTLKSVKVVLTIAHLDHDKTNHKISDDRLKALCQRCHLKYDAKENWSFKR